MQIANKIFIALLILCLINVHAAYCASSSTNFINKEEIFTLSDGSATSSTNFSIVRGQAIGGTVTGKDTSSSYINISGVYIPLSQAVSTFLAMYLSDSDSGSASYTNSQTATITFEVTGSPYQMIISESSDFSGASWQTYAASSEISFESSSEGTKTAYSQLREEDLTTTEVKSASIILDTTPPTIVVSLEGHLIKEGDIISPKPDISGLLDDVYLDISSLIISIDSAAVSDGTSGGGKYDSWDSSTGLAQYAPKTDLAAGSHSLSVSVSDLAGNSTSESLASMEVKSGELSVLGTPLNFPNPFNPETGPTYIAYTLTADSTVSVFIFDITLAPVWRRTYAQGTDGGRAGYNEIAWDGITDFSSTVENGIYYFRIVSESGGSKKVIGKGKIAVLR
ncbi:MAG: hypothetical protein HQ564_02350 [Candidatus Saganbacteria bacterium]|nr:hypothetical protein [Candidatus Saganbacteria bacterium]